MSVGAIIGAHCEGSPHKLFATCVIHNTVTNSSIFGLPDRNHYNLIDPPKGHIVSADRVVSSKYGQFVHPEAVGLIDIVVFEQFLWYKQLPTLRLDIYHFHIVFVK